MLLHDEPATSKRPRSAAPAASVARPPRGVVAARTPLRVLVVDDHPVVRAGVAAVVARLPGRDAAAVTAVGTLAAALAALRAPVGFDLVVLDLGLPDAGAAAPAVGAVRAAAPATPILVLSGHAGRAIILRTLLQGARGYVTKSDGLPAMREALLRVLAGERVIPDCVGTAGAALPASCANRAAGCAAGARAMACMSARERDVLALLLAGHGSREIAAELHVAAGTARGYLARVLGIVHCKLLHDEAPPAPGGEVAGAQLVAAR
jgi:DNA-binding NarL/FixJ family response regulator